MHYSRNDDVYEALRLHLALCNILVFISQDDSINFMLRARQPARLPVSLGRRGGGGGGGASKTARAVACVIGVGGGGGRGGR